MTETEYARAAAEFVQERGVRRCPTACLVPTRVSVPEADRAALRDHAAASDEVRRARLCKYRQYGLAS